MKKKFKIAAFLVTFALLGSIIYIYLESQNSFPALSTGKYVGTISGISTTTTFYVEQLGGTNNLIFVVFHPQFIPQTITMTKNYSLIRSKRVSPDKIPLYPIELVFNDSTFILTGRERGSGYSGHVWQGNKKSGSWLLRKISDNEISFGIDALARSSLDLEEWLQAKIQYIGTQSDLNNLTSSFKDRKEYGDKLREYVISDELLRERAAKRRAMLKDEIQIAQESHKKTNQSVAALVKDLELLERITRRGKVISAARRMSKRESNWYLANWRAEEDQAWIEEFFDASHGMDFKQFNEAVKKAEEAQSLINEAAKERRLIGELESKLAREKELDRRSDSDTQQQEKKQKQRSIWRRLFN
jgi:hypothetical protein